MIKAIIISYNFLPQNITSVQRPYAWLKYFSELGIYPIVITKNWNSKITDKVEIEKTKDYEIVRVKTDLILKEKFAEVNGVKGKILRSLFRFLHFFLFSSLKWGPNKDFYSVARKIITQIDGPKILIITAMPYGLFKVAYKLNKDTGINWIADYRDDWSTSEIPENNIIKYLLLKTYYKRQEIKWVSSASLITSVSPYYVKKILKLLHFSSSKGLVIENGYFKDNYPLFHKKGDKKDEISFIYVGSLYNSQNLMPLIKALNKAVIELKKKRKVKFVFLGTNLSRSRKNDFIKAATHFKFIFYKRLPKQKALKIQYKSQYAIMCPHKGLKGIPSSKLYEFIGANMPVIYYPNDHDIINETLRSCNLGFTSDNEKDLVCLFKDAIEGNLEYKASNCYKYTRKYSTKQLVLKIKELLNNKEYE